MISIGDGIPSEYCIWTNAHALARYAALSPGGRARADRRARGADGRRPHDRARATTSPSGRSQAVFTELFDQRVAREGMLLKPNMVLSGLRLPEQADDDDGRRADAQVLCRTRAGGGPRDRLPVGRPVRRGRDRAAERDERARAAPVGALVLVRARAAGAGAQGLGRRSRAKWKMRKRRSTGGRSSTAPRGRAPTRRNGRRPKSLSEELLRSHVERFNEGVRSGDFCAMLEQFAEDAELAFEGVPVGPFRGKPAIAQAYAEQPPDDEIVILRHARVGRRPRRRGLRLARRAGLACRHDDPAPARRARSTASSSPSASGRRTGRRRAPRACRRRGAPRCGERSPTASA